MASLTDGAASPAALDPKNVTSLAIYPPLGIARVGDCADGPPDDYLVSPEAVGGLPTTPGGRAATSLADYRGADGGLRRHAARFRIYATLRDGSVREVIAGCGVEIEWRVAIANLKAGWYEFNQAMDLPGGLARPANRRNAGFAGDRSNSTSCPNRLSFPQPPAPRRLPSAAVCSSASPFISANCASMATVICWSSAALESRPPTTE